MGDWQHAGEDEVLAGLAAAQQRMNGAYRELLEVVAEAERRGLAGAHGYVDAVRLVACTQNVSKAEARRRVAAAGSVLPGRTLTGAETAAPLPAAAQALAEHAISHEHVDVIRQILGALKPHLEPHRAELEEYLAEQARTFDPHSLRTLGKRRVAFLDPDGPKPRDGSPSRNRLSFAEDGAGWDVRGWLDRESAAVLRSALSPLSAPRPASGGCEDAPAEPAEKDPRTFAEREGDALVELARRVMTAGALPLERAERPQVTVVIPLEVLEERIAGAGLMGFADGIGRGAITAERARRWACDAEVVPVVLGEAGQPLDVGRSARTAPRWLRRALRQRDGGCAFPNCPIPAQWCEAHHIIHWACGGETSLDNTVLLCGAHHDLLHVGDWTVAITDGFPLFHPPPWVPGGPRRNALHRVDRPHRTSRAPGRRRTGPPTRRDGNRAPARWDGALRSGGAPPRGRAGVAQW
ncbi:HNH endonuclease signature motif containing protein [Pseudonocardia zijingensis]|uniref:HNH endonuclease signature motif containing protein n=1 Tax=Pseudonocardia zijingensis TaxID=153376 RepID=A0ABP4A2E1_9PSEU